MQLTRYTDYGLRVLMYLALLPEGQNASIDTVCQTYGISRNNINKIVHHLGKAGFIRTQRGKGGGITLNRPAQDIGLGDAVRVMESTLTIIDCNKPACTLLPACRLKGALAQAVEAFLSVLDSYTLADLTAPAANELRQQLKLA